MREKSLGRQAARAPPDACLRTACGLVGKLGELLGFGLPSSWCGYGCVIVNGRHPQGGFPHSLQEWKRCLRAPWLFFKPLMEIVFEFLSVARMFGAARRDSDRRLSVAAVVGR